MTEQKEILKSLVKAQKQHIIKTYVPYSAMTFAEVEAMQSLRTFSSEVVDKAYILMDLIDNVLFNMQDELSLSSMVTKINGLVREFQEELASLSPTGDKSIDANPKPYFSDDHIKVKGEGFTVYKVDGQDYFYGQFTNAYYDKEADVLTESAHLKYMAFLDENPEAAPTLWDYHIEGTARKNKAVWWDYADNMVHMIWPLEEEESKAINHVVDTIGLEKIGMSHGFWVIDKEEETGQIKEYKTFEASILLLEHAANPYTSIEVLKAMAKGFSEDKRNFLLTMHNGDEDFVNSLESDNQEKVNQLLELGVEAVKELQANKNENEAAPAAEEETTPTPAEEPTTEEGTTEEPTTEEPATEEPTEAPATEGVAQTIEAMEEKVVGIVEALLIEVKQLSNRIGVIETREDKKANAATHGSKLDALHSIISSPIGDFNATKGTEDLPSPTEAEDGTTNKVLGSGLIR